MGESQDEEVDPDYDLDETRHGIDKDSELEDWLRLRLSMLDRNWVGEKGDANFSKCHEEE